MANVKIPCYLTIARGSAQSASPRVIAGNSYQPVDVKSTEAVFFFEIEVDDEWIKPSVRTGVTLRFTQDVLPPADFWAS
jgi:hypothetical protein